MKRFIKKETFIILFFLILFPVYKFVIINPHLIWKIDKQNPDNSIYDKFYQNKLQQLKKVYFIHKNNICFYSNTSRINFQYKIPANMIISGSTGSKGVVLYKQNGNSISFIQKNKGYSWKYKTFAYPFLTMNDNIIFLITGENGGYGTLNINGEIITEPLSSGMFLTSFDICSHTNFIFIGYSNGYIKLFNKKLEEKWFKKFLKSKIQIVKQVSASSKGMYFAALSGLDPEYLNILDRNGTMLQRFKSPDNRRRPIEMKFSFDEKYLLEESEKGFRLYSLKRKKLIMDKHLFPKNHKRQLISMDISFDGMYIITAYKINNDISAAALMDREGTIYFRLFFENEKPLVKFSFQGYNFQIETKNKIYLYNI